MWQMGRSVELHVYPGMDHEMQPQEVKEVKIWLGATAARTNAAAVASGPPGGEGGDGGLEGLETNVRLLTQRADALRLTPDALNGLSAEQLRELISQFATTTLDRTALQKVANACVRVTSKAKP
jgi:hypothetical protein